MHTAANDAKAIDVLRGDDSIDVVVLDIWLEGSKKDGMALMHDIMELRPYVPIIIISGHATVEHAIQATKLGAYDFIEKPFKADKIVITAKRAIESAILSMENRDLKKRYHGHYDYVYKSKVISELLKQARAAALSNSRILVTGAPGTGKEVLALYIHEHSKRSKKPFITMHAANVSADSIERELFGVDDGIVKSEGMLERANGGTLFIDEISEMPLEAQAKFLKVLNSATFVKTGGNSIIQSDVRIITSTCRNLEQCISEGDFNESLYYRLKILPLAIPKLSEHKEDIPILCEYFISMLSQQLGLPEVRLADSIVKCMQIYAWPGNVRELRNTLEWLMIMSPIDERDISDISQLPGEMRVSLHKSHDPLDYSKIKPLSLKEARDNFEREYIKVQLQRFDFNISNTAKFIGMDRTALHRKIKQLNIFDEAQ